MSVQRSEFSILSRQLKAERRTPNAERVGELWDQLEFLN